MRNDEIPLLVLHGALSAIPYAIQQSMPEVPMDITVQWRNSTHLTVLVETYGRWVERVVAQLNHGVMPDEYDYRFKAVGHPTGFEPGDYVTVSGMMALSHVPPEEAKLARWRKLESAS